MLGGRGGDPPQLLKTGVNITGNELVQSIAERDV